MTDEVESFLKILMINCSSVLHLQLSRKWQLPFFKNLVSDAIYLELFFMPLNYNEFLYYYGNEMHLNFGQFSC